MFTGYIKVDKVSEEELAELIDRLLAGDEEAIPEIVKAYIPLAMGMARSAGYRYPHRLQDLQGAALLGLTEGVTRFQTKGYDKNIGPFIAKTVRSFIQDYISRDHIVRVPRSTHNRTGAEVFTSSLATMNGYGTGSNDSDNPTYGVDRARQADYELPTVDHPEFEFQALIDELGLKDKEAQTLDMLLQGYTRAEIAKKMEVSRSYIENNFIFNIKKKCHALGLCESIFRVAKSPTRKECKKCKVSKSTSDFRVVGGGRWVTNICKECGNK